MIGKSDAKTFSSLMGDFLMEKAKKDDRIVAITAAMCEATGLHKFSREYPNRFFDVGIAEEHAVSFAAGLANGRNETCSMHILILSSALI